jgi:hypothetical protein
MRAEKRRAGRAIRKRRRQMRAMSDTFRRTARVFGKIGLAAALAGPAFSGFARAMQNADADAAYVHTILDHDAEAIARARELAHTSSLTYREAAERIAFPKTPMTAADLDRIGARHTAALLAARMNGANT